MGNDLAKIITEPLAQCCSDCQRYVLNSCDFDVSCSECCKLSWHTHEVAVSDSENDLP